MALITQTVAPAVLEVAHRQQTGLHILEALEIPLPQHHRKAIMVEILVEPRHLLLEEAAVHLRQELAVLVHKAARVERELHLQFPVHQ